MERKRFVPAKIICILLVFCMVSAPVTAQAAVYTYYKKYMTTAEQKVYKNLTAAGKKESLIGSELDFSYQETFDISLSRLGICFTYDHPEFFWMTNAVGYTFTSGSSAVFYTLEQWDGCNSKKSLARFKNAAGSAVKKVKKQAKGKSIAEKVRVIHDYICRTTKYKVNKFDQSSYGVFVKHRAVCQGYALAFKYLCDRLRIPCIALCDSSHAWNMVKISGKWYHVDCTWDDTDTGWNYDFFLKGWRTMGLSYQNYTLCGIPLPTMEENDYEGLDLAA